jgi:recombinational DNA repair protein RecR|tara:strand:- start:452 stop:634 length:183 start_codon:yes stop_codon:yes gene_type:complete
MDIDKLKKPELIAYIKELEETKYNNLKIATGLPYNTDEEWVDYIQNLKSQFKKFLDNSIK